MNSLRLKCPLCLTLNMGVFALAYQRNYQRCSECALIYMDPVFCLSPEQEHARYLTHENSPEDQGYQAFLKPAFEALFPLLSKQAKGLDFGCGDGSPLPKMFEGGGCDVALYDPYFYPDKSVLKESYDFIVSTETFEHFNQPKKEMENVLTLLKPKGYLGVMTLFFDTDDVSAFQKSYYSKDPTHVVFYSTATFEWMAKRYALNVDFPKKNIAIFQKK